MPRHNTTKSRALKNGFRRQKYGIPVQEIAGPVPARPPLGPLPHDAVGRAEMAKPPVPWPLNEAEIDLPDDPPPDELAEVHTLLLERPITLGTVRVHWAGRVIVGDDAQDIEVRVDTPECIEVGGYALRRQDARKLRALLELALFLLGAAPEEGDAA